MENVRRLGVNRRKLLKLGAASIIAAPFADIAGLISLAAGQEKSAVVKLPPNHLLSRTAISQARRFPIGNQVISLDLDVKSEIVAIVEEYTLPDSVASSWAEKRA